MQCYMLMNGFMVLDSTGWWIDAFGGGVGSTVSAAKCQSMLGSVGVCQVAHTGVGLMRRRFVDIGGARPAASPMHAHAVRPCSCRTVPGGRFVHGLVCEAPRGGVDACMRWGSAQSEVWYRTQRTQRIQRTQVVLGRQLRLRTGAYDMSVSATAGASTYRPINRATATSRPSGQVRTQGSHDSASAHLC